jgi:hypothetical protein
MNFAINLLIHTLIYQIDHRYFICMLHTGLGRRGMIL